MVFNQQKIITLYFASKDAPSWYIQLNMFLKILRELPDCSPLIAGSAGKTCQHHLETRAANVWDLVRSHQ